MKKIKSLHHRYFRSQLRLSRLKFKTIHELKITTEFLGQKRALDAIHFGIGIQKNGYNLYAMGPIGIGKRSLVRAILKEKAKKKPVPADWCYIYNFDEPDKPLAIELPPGRGAIFKEDMQGIVNSLSVTILVVFESDEYRKSMLSIQEDFKKKQDIYTQKAAAEKDIRTMNSYKKRLMNLYKKKHQKERKLQLKLTAKAVKPSIKKLKKKYAAYRHVIKFLRAMEKDIILNVNDFIKKEEVTHMVSFIYDNPHLDYYQVNLLVDNGKRSSAPVIFEENPNFVHLVGRIEYISRLGMTTTQFNLIKPGSLHLANGGYLIMEAHKLLKEKHAWEALKRALKLQKITIDLAAEPSHELFRPVSLQPASIPLHIKVILLGSRRTYYDLCDDDPDFNELFKVPVDFDEYVDRTEKNIYLFARLIATMIRKEKLRSFEAQAIAEIVDYSSRLAEDNEKLSTDLQSIHDLVIEADYLAGLKNKKTVKAVDIQQAIQAQIKRVNRSQQLYYEAILRNIVKINTKNRMVGQLNCLSIVRIGRYAYGHPLRVTATVRQGREKFIDIQREIKMAGPIHSKAGLTIINFLGSRYGRDRLFRLCASISFEQVYGTVDGDSASVGETCALLSALSGIPLKQFLAITGSIDQYGVVQAVGGLNEKIEGFFNICKQRGLDGNQGVIIPAVNIKNLMLSEEIILAGKLKKFFIYPIETIDDAITLLTDLPAGQFKDGQFEKNSFNDLVDRQLNHFQLLLNHATSHPGSTST